MASLFPFFSLYEKQWKPVAPLKTQRQQLCVCEVGGMIYAIAGTDGINRMKSVEVFSLDTNEWTDTTPLQVCFQGWSSQTIMVGLSNYSVYFFLGNHNGHTFIGIISVIEL